MFDLGLQELIVIFVVALLVFGPNKLPELARTVGKAVFGLKKALYDAKAEVDKEVHELERPVEGGESSQEPEKPDARNK